MLERIDKPKDCTGPCCSDFWRIESLEDVPLPSLKNPIHPLFTRNKLQCLYSTLNHDAILDRSAQLATKLLEASLPFWHSLLFGDIRDQGELEFWKTKGKTGHKTQWEIYNEVDTLTQPQQQKTTARLQELAAYVRYQVDSTDLEGDEGGAFTEAEEWIGIGHDPQVFWSGRKSYIQISGHFEANMKVEKTTDAVSYHWHAFYLAKVLVHELVHAAVNTRRPEVKGDDPNDVSESQGNLFFEGSDVAEPGFEWEKRTFGGLLTSCGPGPRKHKKLAADGSDLPLGPSFYKEDDEFVPFAGMIRRRQWPCVRLSIHYKNTESQIGIRDDANLSIKSSFWNVSFQDIHRLFQQDFWTKVDLTNKEALWPQQRSGMMWPWPAADGNVDVPAGYQMLGTGLIVPAGMRMDEDEEESKEDEEDDDAMEDEDEDDDGEDESDDEDEDGMDVDNEQMRAAHDPTIAN